MTAPVIDPTPTPEATPNVLRGVVRTIVPYVIGLLVTWLGSKGIDLPDDVEAQLSALITVVVGSLWYTVVRQLEKGNPLFGVLIGAKGAPVYLPPDVPIPPDEPAVVPAADGDDEVNV